MPPCPPLWARGSRAPGANKPQQLFPDPIAAAGEVRGIPAGRIPCRGIARDLGATNDPASSKPSPQLLAQPCSCLPAGCQGSRVNFSQLIKFYSRAQGW